MQIILYLILGLIILIAIIGIIIAPILSYKYLFYTKEYKKKRSKIDWTDDGDENIQMVITGYTIAYIIFILNIDKIFESFSKSNDWVINILYSIIGILPISLNYFSKKNPFIFLKSISAITLILYLLIVLFSIYKVWVI